MWIVCISVSAVTAATGPALLRAGHLKSAKVTKRLRLSLRRRLASSAPWARRDSMAVRG